MTEKRRIEPLSKEELNQLAKDVATDKVLLGGMVPDELLVSVFLPITFGALQNVDLDTVGEIYEYVDKAGPRSINGYPMFMSMKILAREQMPEFVEKVRKIKAVLDTL